MKITKKSTTYDVEHDGRAIYVFVSHEHNKTHFDEAVAVSLPSGKVVTDNNRVLELDRCVQESDIERVLMEALA